jgi:hypothetical protein
LIHKVAASGGHLGPNLGVVELTLALHRVFDSPHDPIVFDTGHQAYVHKMLTGRCDHFDSLRKQGGLSGYPSRSESVHDWVENSHASTALSYAEAPPLQRPKNGWDDDIEAAPDRVGGAMTDQLGDCLAPLADDAVAIDGHGCALIGPSRLGRVHTLITVRALRQFTA